MKLFLPSPRNPVATNIALLEQTDCHKILFAKEAQPIAGQINEAYKVSSAEIHSFDEMLQMETKEVLIYDHTFDQEKDNPVVILHSSGSTGT